jgi:hypothetical protein
MAKDHDDLSPAALPELPNRGDADSYERSDDDKKIYGDEKDDHRNATNVVVEPAVQDHLDDVLAMEERIQKGTATREVSGGVCAGGSDSALIKIAPIALRNMPSGTTTM